MKAQKLYPKSVLAAVVASMMLTSVAPTQSLAAGRPGPATLNGLRLKLIAVNIMTRAEELKPEVNGPIVATTIDPEQATPETLTAMQRRVNYILADYKKFSDQYNAAKAEMEAMRSSGKEFDEEMAAKYAGLDQRMKDIDKTRGFIRRFNINIWSGGGFKNIEGTLKAPDYGVQFMKEDMISDGASTILIPHKVGFHFINQKVEDPALRYTDNFVVGAVPEQWLMLRDRKYVGEFDESGGPYTRVELTYDPARPMEFSAAFRREVKEEEKEILQLVGPVMQLRCEGRNIYFTVLDQQFGPSYDQHVVCVLPNKQGNLRFEVLKPLAK